MADSLTLLAKSKEKGEKRTVLGQPLHKEEHEEFIRILRKPPKNRTARVREWLLRLRWC